MSRDWCPAESYYWDKEISTKKTGKHFYEMELKWHYSDSDEVHEDENQKRLQEIAKDYQYLVITNPDGVKDLIKNLKNETLNNLERQVKHLCECVDNNEDIANANVDDFVKLWFVGKLDESFYYREHNDELLLDKLKEKETI